MTVGPRVQPVTRGVDLELLQHRGNGVLHGLVGGGQRLRRITGDHAKSGSDDDEDMYPMMQRLADVEDSVE